MAQYLTTLVRILLVLMSGMSKWNRVHFRRHLGWVLPPNPVCNHYPFRQFWDGGYLSLRLSLQVLLVSVLLISTSYADWEECWRLYKRGDVNLNGIQYDIGDAVVFVRVRIYGEGVLIDSCQYWAADMDRDLVPFTVNDLQLLLEAIAGEEFLLSVHRILGKNTDIFGSSLGLSRSRFFRFFGEGLPLKSKPRSHPPTPPAAPGRKSGSTPGVRIFLAPGVGQSVGVRKCEPVK